MIVEVNFQVFQAMFLSNLVYVKEKDDAWELWTSQDLFHIRCTVEKSEDQEKNMMFVDRYLAEKKNIIRVIEVTPEDDEDDKKVPMDSGEAIRKVEEVENPENTADSIENVKGATSFNDDHYHFYELDENKNGKTLRTLPKDHPHHTHEIINAEVQESNEHIHLIADNIEVEQEDDVEEEEDEL